MRAHRWGKGGKRGCNKAMTDRESSREREWHVKGKRKAHHHDNNLNTSKQLVKKNSADGS